MGGGTVTFSCSGTIILTGWISPTANPTSIDGSEQTITISGNNAVQVFDMGNGATLNLNELTIANGNSGDGYGGGGIITTRHAEREQQHLLRQ